MNKRKALGRIGRALAALPLAGGGLLACSGEQDNKPSFSSVDITGATFARNFSLPDLDGKLRSLSDFAGKAVVVFFGFTQCPDVCPTTMAELAQAKALLGADGERLQGVFITVDPERDTAESLRAYMASFDPGFVALRPTPEQLAEVAKEFKVYYKKVDGKTPGSYTMDHSAASFVFDPQGRIRLYTRYGSAGGVPALAADLRLLLKAA